MLSLGTALWWVVPAWWVDIRIILCDDSMISVRVWAMLAYASVMIHGNASARPV